MNSRWEFSTLADRAHTVEPRTELGGLPLDFVVVATDPPGDTGFQGLDGAPVRPSKTGSRATRRFPGNALAGQEMKRRAIEFLAQTLGTQVQGTKDLSTVG